MLVGQGEEEGEEGKLHRACRAGHGLGHHCHDRKVSRYRTACSSKPSAWLVHETLTKGGGDTTMPVLTHLGLLYINKLHFSKIHCSS